MSGWMDDAKRASLADVAQWFRMRSGRDGRSFGPCPACGAAARGRSDRRPPLRLGNDSRSWRCFACDAGGSVIDLVAHHLGQPPAHPSVRAWFAQNGHCDPLAPERHDTPRHQRPPGPRTVVELDEARPPPAEPALVEALWHQCGSLAGDAGRTYPWQRWLERRGLDQDAIAASDLVRLLSHDVLPPFASHWRWFEVQLVLPLFDATGRLCGLQGRTLDGERKSIRMQGVSVSGLVLASPAARRALAGEPWPRGPDGTALPLWVVEGEPDFLSMLARRPGATAPEPDAIVIGLPGSGSWTESIADRIPDGVRVLIATDQDAAGDEYAALVHSTLQKRCSVTRLRWEPGPEPSQPRDINDHDIEGIPFEPREEPVPDRTEEADDPSSEADPYANSWHNMAQWAALEGFSWTERPPPQRWLLRVAPERVDGRELGPGPGVLPRGDVGLFSGAGAVGKSYALLQLAIAVAMPLEAHQAAPDRFAWFGGLHPGTSTPIEGGWRVDEPGGRVVMVVAEEDLEHTRRRVYRILSALGLVGSFEGGAQSAASRWLAELFDNLVLVPGRGNYHLGWIDEHGAPAVGYHALQQHLARDEHRLVILDPLARFGGAETEKDNSAATLLVQLAERLSMGPGQPNVLLSAHTSQAARQARATDATATRGVTGLGDGGRWGAIMVSRPVLPGAPQLIEAAPNKANHAPHTPPLIVVRREDGVLSRATPQQLEDYTKAKEAAEVAAKLDKARTNGQPVGMTEPNGTRHKEPSDVLDH